MLGDLAKLLSAKGIKAEFTDECRDLVAEKSYSEKYGARNMRRYIETHVEDKMAELIISCRGEISAVKIDSDGENVTVEKC